MHTCFDNDHQHSSLQFPAMPMSGFLTCLTTCMFNHAAVDWCLQVILSDAIVKLEPDYFWLGGGEVDLKLGIKTLDFTQIVKPFITDCTYSSDDTTVC
jgi:hypothetical protein